MPPETREFLAILAEVAIGTVALSGITMVLLMARQDPGERQTGLVASQLAMAFAAVVASLVPLLLNTYGLPISQIWMLSSAVYATIILTLQVPRFLPRARFPRISGLSAVIVTAPGASGMVLLGANLWIRTEWPYLTQLLLALATSMILYLYFMLISLTPEQQP